MLYSDLQLSDGDPQIKIQAALKRRVNALFGEQSAEVLPYLGHLLGISLEAELAERVRLLVVGGKHLTNEEALALAQYSVANDLNPMIGECYYLPNVGPGPGIAGWRKKAELQLREEARRANEPRARYWCDYSEPDQKEIKTNPGDIAIKATLHDDLTKTAWEQRRLKYFIEMKKAGINATGGQLPVSTLIVPIPAIQLESYGNLTAHPAVPLGV